MENTILNCKHHTITEKGVITNQKTGNVKSQWIGANGYYHVDIQEHGVSKKYAVHRLLALQYIPNPNNKRTVNHINGDKLDNNLHNLEWSTHSENMKHAYDNKLNKCTTKKVTQKALKEILIRFLQKESLTQISKDYDFSLSTISTYLKPYADSVGKLHLLEKEKQRQKALRNKHSNQKTTAIIMCDIDTQKELQSFVSIKDAGRFLGKQSTGSISNALLGRQKSAYGYLWKYKN